MASEALRMPEVSAENGTSLTQSTPSFQHNKIWGMFGKLAGGGGNLTVRRATTINLPLVISERQRAVSVTKKLIGR